MQRSTLGVLRTPYSGLHSLLCCIYSEYCTNLPIRELRFLYSVALEKHLDLERAGKTGGRHVVLSPPVQATSSSYCVVAARCLRLLAALYMLLGIAR
jgi:hypothetical protein